MILCADAVLDCEDLIGDPTEGALIVLAAKGGLDIAETRRSYPRIAEVPFDSDYKFMATFHQMTGAGGKPVVRCYVKGAPDVLISRGGSYRSPDGTVVAVTDHNPGAAFAATVICAVALVGLLTVTARTPIVPGVAVREKPIAVTPWAKFVAMPVMSTLSDWPCAALAGATCVSAAGPAVTANAPTLVTISPPVKPRGRRQKNPV